MASRVTQLGVEVLHTGASGGASRITQLGVEVLHQGSPKARLTQFGVEVLCTVADAVPPRPKPVLSLSQ
jgi:hypothetical protein